MTVSHSTATARILVAVDVAKAKHDVLVELPGGARKKMIVRNCRDEFQQLTAYLKSLSGVCEIALEPTADYHPIRTLIICRVLKNISGDLFPNLYKVLQS